MLGCTPAVSYLNTCFISSHRPVTTIYFPFLFFFLFLPSSTVLPAQNASASLVADDRFQTVHSGITDPPYYLNCSEQGKAPLYSHISAENLWCWGEANYRLISNHPDCVLFRAQSNEFFFQLFANVNKIPHFKWKSKAAWVCQQTMN